MNFNSKRVSLMLIAAALLASTGLSHAQKAAAKAPVKAAAPSAAPGFLGANGLPRVGMRILYDSGQTTYKGATEGRTDENGNRVDENGNRLPAMPLENQSGVGFLTMDIVQSSPSLVAADVSNYLRAGENLSSISRMGSSVAIGDSNHLFGSWISPAILRKQPLGMHGDTNYTRGPLSFGGRTLTVFSSRQVNRNGVIDTIYDMGSGLMLLLHSTLRANPLSNVAPEQDAKFDTVTRLMGVRKLGFSWAGSAPPVGLTPGRQLSYQGGMQTSFPNPNMPATPASPMNSTITVSKRAGLCVFTDESSFVNSGNGAPQQFKTKRVYGSASTDALWVPPTVIAALKPGQVVDQDSVTGFTVTFVGIQNGAATFQEQNPTQRNLRFYNAQSGLLVGSRSDMQIGSGNGASVQTIFMQLAGNR